MEKTSFERNQNTKCPCKKLKCERHGNCDACREYHKTDGNKYIPVCERKYNNAVKNN